MSFVGFMSSIDCQFTICGDFNVHVDVPKGDGVKFLSVFDSCNLKQLVTKPTHLPSPWSHTGPYSCTSRWQLLSRCESI